MRNIDGMFFLFVKNMKNQFALLIINHRTNDENIKTSSIYLHYKRFKINQQRRIVLFEWNICTQLNLLDC